MTQLQKKSTSIVDTVTNRVQKLEELGQLIIPKDYSAANAIRAAWLDLEEQTVERGGKKLRVLDLATKPSIIKSMLKMVIMGLSSAKGQGDFILYGNILKFSPEYHGNKLLAKRWANVKKINHHTIYKGDEVRIEIDEEGCKKVFHKPKFENVNMDNIVGAYCVVIFNDGSRQDEIMNKHQITKAWLQGPMKGQSPAHKNFPDAMSEKSVANRILTRLYKASDEGAVLEKVEKEEEFETKPSDMKELKPKDDSFGDEVDFEEEYNDGTQADEQPEQDPESTPEPEKKESKPKTPKKEEKPAEQPEMDFDDEPKEPF